jgi:hypothetical protein
MMEEPDGERTSSSRSNDEDAAESSPLPSCQTRAHCIEPEQAVKQNSMLRALSGRLRARAIRPRARAPFRTASEHTRTTDRSGVRRKRRRGIQLTRLKRRLDVALFVALLAVLGGLTGAALARAFGGTIPCVALGIGAGLLLGLAYAARVRLRRPHDRGEPR